MLIKQFSDLSCKQIMNRIHMIIHYRSTTYIGLIISLIQKNFQVFYLPINRRYIQKLFLISIGLLLVFFSL